MKKQSPMYHLGQLCRAIWPGTADVPKEIVDTVLTKPLSGLGLMTKSNEAAKADQNALAEIIDQVEDKSRVGVCIDTCHSFAAGYNLLTAASCDAVFAEFDRIVGFNYLRGMHLNDSKKELGSRVDRHHSLGKGELGLDVFKYIMNDPRFDNMPLILETIDETIWAEEIKLLRSYEGK